MTLAKLVARSLACFWRTNLMVAVGIAVATAVIVGALLIDHSVKASLCERALARLGGVESAVVAPRFFGAKLGDSALLLVDAAVSNEAGEVLPKASVVGADERFSAVFGQSLPSLSERNVAVSESLARDLNLKVGDALFATLAKPSFAPAGTLFARRTLRDTRQTERLTVAAVLPDRGVGGFSLTRGTEPRNLFIDRSWLASRLGRPGTANALVARGEPPPLNNVAPRDLGLNVIRRKGYVSVQSDRLVIGSALARSLGGRPTSTQLATAITLGNRSISYAVLAWAPGVAAPSRDGILLNPWAAKALGARPGERVKVDLLAPRDDGGFDTKTIQLKVEGVVHVIDPGLTPDFEGISDARTIADWNPPFPVDLGRVTDADEAYWDRYRAAPKAFVSEKTIRAAWGDSSDTVTSVRFPGATAQEVERRVVRAVSPESVGLAWRPVRREAIEAAEGSTEFGALFLGLGMFIVFAGAGLAGMTARLNVARRSAQTGLMLACGIEGAVVRRAALIEGLVLSIAGPLLGAAVGVAYASGLVWALRTSWRGAVGGSPIDLHLASGPIAWGALAGAGVGLLVTFWASRGQTALPALALLRGGPGVEAAKGAKPARTAWLALAFALAGLTAPGFSSTGHTEPFFVGGALLLAAAVLAMRATLIAAMRARAGRSFAQLALRNAAAHRGQSLLIFGLIASATFVLVAVAANGRDPGPTDPSAKRSGTGGFSLIATSGMPIGIDFGTPEGRQRLDFRPEDEPAFDGVRVVSFLMSGGDDASCANPAKAVAPRMLGVGRSMIERGGFKLAGAGWSAIAGGPHIGEVPAFGDSETLTWALKTQLGGRLSVPAGTGRMNLRIKGVLASSVLAGELLIPEVDFRRAFPDQDAPRFFLIETPRGREEQVAAALRRNLGEAGLEVRTTRETLRGLIGVQNAYLSTFLALGGFGLLLGAAGLAASALRSALERRKELALLLALGFGKRRVALLLAMESAAPLLAGLLAGAGCAGVAMIPALTSVEAKVDWAGLAVALAGCLLVGMASSFLAAAIAVRGRLLPALRSE